MTISSLFRRMPLTAKMVFITLSAGVAVWGMLDYVQTPLLRAQFHANLLKELELNNQMNRIILDRLIKRFHNTALILISQKEFGRHVEQVARGPWKTEKPLANCLTTHPPWLPRNSVLRNLLQAQFTLLVDADNHVREIYLQDKHILPPQALLQPSGLLILLSHSQSYMTEINGAPYLITSEPYRDEGEEHLATLMLATPIDDNFMNLLREQVFSRSLLVLLRGERDPQVITTSNPQEAPRGTSLSQLHERFLVTSLESFDYGSSDLLLQFASLVTKKEMEDLSRSILGQERRARLFLALTLVLTFTGVMVWLTRRVQNLDAQVRTFARRELGEPLVDEEDGDQLHHLKMRFAELTRNVRLAHNSLRKSAEEFQAVVENVADAIVIFNETPRITVFNPAAQRLFGYPAEMMLGESPARLLADAFKAQHPGRFDRHLAQGFKALFGRRLEITAQHRDGTPIPLSLTISHMETSGQRLFIVAASDITERKRHEEVLKASESRFRALIETIPHGIEESDREGVITLSNPAHARIHGLTREEMVGRPLWSLIHPPEEQEKMRLRFAGIMVQQPAPTPWNHRHVTRDGKIIDVQVDWNYRRNQQGQVMGLIAVITDITERKKAEARLRQQSDELAHVARLQTMGEIASGLAHELNQPLAAILNYARGSALRLRLGSLSPEDLTTALERISEQAERVGGVVRSLRGFLRKGVSHKELADFNQIIREAVNFADFETRRRGVALRLELAAEPLPVRADPIQIQQVIINLIQNSVDAMSQETVNIRVITLATRKSDTRKEVEFLLSDSGPGFPEDLLERIFEPFFTTKEKGMGLGLSISRSIVENHDGHLTAENGPHGGAVFHLLLPSSLIKGEPSR